MLKLTTLLQKRPWTEALERGEITSPIVSLDIGHIDEVSDHFKPFVRELAYDCGELPTSTFLQAKAYNIPLSLLPFVVADHFHHGSIVYNSQKLGRIEPVDLRGMTVGVRAYSQTGPTWVRGILQNEYDVDLDMVNWLAFEGPPVVEHRDPASVSLAPRGKKMVDMLFNGEIDAAISGSSSLKDPRLTQLIPNAADAAEAWSKKYGDIAPINHMFVVKTSLLRSNPEAVKEIYRLLVEARSRGSRPPANGARTPFGIEPNRKSLELMIKYAYQQHVIPRAFSVDELFEGTARVLGL